MNGNKNNFSTLLAKAFARNNGNEILLSSLGTAIRQIDPNFSLDDYECSTLKELVSNYPDLVEVKKDAPPSTKIFVRYLIAANPDDAASSPPQLHSETRRNIGLVVRWNEQQGFGFIEPKDRSDDLFVHFSKIGREFNGFLAEGDVVEYDSVKGERGMEAFNVSFVKWLPPSNHLRAFADMGPFTWLENLAEMAEKNEPWTYANTTDSNPLPILSNYIKHTFQRLEEMADGIAYSKNNDWAAFNTGLVTPNQEEIYAMFAAIPRPMRQHWKLVGFKKASERVFVEQFGGAVPPLADYFDDPSVLLYDRRCPLVINIDHVMQNLDRFPAHLQANPYVARQLLTSAEATTRKRVYRNYKTAIPQFFRDKGREGVVQLLLPICLEQPGKADLALAVQRSGDAYLGSTVLTLDMAYNNARLLARPDTEWLQP